MSQGSERDVLIVVDIQRDFFKGGPLQINDPEGLIEPLNTAIKDAEGLGMLIIFTQDWHPANHNSFTKWPPHCIINTEGAELHEDIYKPLGHRIVRFGQDADALGYSPYENPEMERLINNEHIGRVFVTGIALDYCVKETCLDTCKRNKETAAIEPLIRAVSSNKDELEEVWKTLTDCGVRRVRAISFH